MKASPLVNLGADRVRMKDQRDVDRQQATVQHLLDRFYTDKEEEQYELQVVADEVGMGNRAHIVTPSITVRGLLNVAALAGSEVSSYG